MRNWPIGTRRQRLLGGVSLILLAAGVAFAFEPVCRSIVRRAAERRGLHVEVGRAWPSWSGLRLADTRLTLADVKGMEALVSEATIEWGPFSGIVVVDVRGVRVVAHGPPVQLAAQLGAWRDHRRAAATEVKRGPVSPQVTIADGSFVWDEDGATSAQVELSGLAGTRNATGLTASLASAKARYGSVTFDLGPASLHADAAGILSAAHAAYMSVDFAGPPRTNRQPAPAGPPSVEGGSAVEASTPLIELPDLHKAHDTALKVAALLAQRLAPEGQLAIDGVTARVSTRSGSTVAIGPGELAVSRGPARIQVDFGAGATARGPSLTARAVLPIEDGDTSLHLQSGPVSLGELGVQDGNAGLFDVAHSTVSGHAHLAVDAEVHGLTFDCTASARGVSVRDPVLAADDVRGLDAQIRARGTFTLPGDLRFDDLAATVGALRFEASGVLDQTPDHVEAAFRLAVPSTACNTALNSIPTALLPLASAMAFNGTFAADGRVFFDSRSLDDLELEYRVEDGCRATAVPPALSRDAFRHPFTHRVYLPDGTVEDEEAGPGTASWTPLDQISPYMEVAVTTTEDGAFRHHHGFNRGAIRASIIANLKARRFVRGASTITMQLAKNLFLSREKTLSRKLEEVILTDYLEQILTKDEILELYFNVVEFGPAVYGIAAAADYYFGRAPADLNLAEAFFLASILPSPLRSASVRDAPGLPEGRMAALRSLMRIAHDRGLLNDQQLAEGQRASVEFWHGGEKPVPHAGIPARLNVDAPSSRQDSDPRPIDAEP
jgi:hypothetical protein